MEVSIATSVQMRSPSARNACHIVSVAMKGSLFTLARSG